MHATEALRSAEHIDKLVVPFLFGHDLGPGFLSGLNLPEFFGSERLGHLKQKLAAFSQGLALIVGCGGTLVAKGDILVYADVTRWEAQLRFRRDESSNLGVEKRRLAANLQY